MDMCVSFKISTAVTNHLAVRMRKGIFRNRGKKIWCFKGINWKLEQEDRMGREMGGQGKERRNKKH